MKREGQRRAEYFASLVEKVKEIPVAVVVGTLIQVYDRNRDPILEKDLAALGAGNYLALCPFHADPAAAEQTKDAAGYRRFKFQQAFGRNCPAVITGAQESFRFPAEAGIVLSKKFRRPSDCLQGSGIFLDEQRDHLMPDPVSPIRVALIGAVFNMRDVMLREILLNLLPGCLQQRADQSPSNRWDPRKAPCPRPAAEIHQHRLRVVVEIVRRGNSITAEPVGGFLQEAITQRSCRFLRSKSVLVCIKSDIAVLHGTGNAEAAALFGHKLRITKGLFSSKAVFKVRRKKRDLIRLPQIAQPMKKTHAVRTAGYRNKDPAFPGQHRPSPDQVILHRSGVPQWRRMCIPEAS